MFEDDRCSHGFLYVMRCVECEVKALSRPRCWSAYVTKVEDWCPVQLHKHMTYGDTCKGCVYIKNNESR